MMQSACQIICRDVIFKWKCGCCTSTKPIARVQWYCRDDTILVPTEIESRSVIPTVCTKMTGLMPSRLSTVSNSTCLTDYRGPKNLFCLSRNYHMNLRLFESILKMFCNKNFYHILSLVMYTFYTLRSETQWSHWLQTYVTQKSMISCLLQNDVASFPQVLLMLKTAVWCVF